MKTRWLLAVALASCLCAQETLNNETIVKLFKAGVGDDVIVNMVNQQPGKYSLTADAIIALKTAGVSDKVISAMIVRNGAGNAIGQSFPETADRAGNELFKKALDSFGPRDKLATVHAVKWKGTSVQTATGTTASYRIERVTIYPDKFYLFMQASNGYFTKVVVTSDLNYVSSGKAVGSVPASALSDYRDGVKLDSFYIAQHAADFRGTSEGTEQIESMMTAKLRINGPGREMHWSVDPQTGRLLRSRFTNAAFQEIVVDYSDWRLIDGIYVPFQRHTVEPGRTTDVSISEYEVNPMIEPNLFDAPTQQSAAGFSFKVLQSESVPYVVQTGGGISTNCQISGSTNTTFSATTMGNTTFGNATINPNLRMNCSSTDNTVRWTHVLNAMLVEASDGNAYIIACDRAWRWSKCSALKPGDVFNARQTDKGFMVQFVNTKSEEKEATYSVLQAKSLR
jgi:hypothetical protein